MTATWRPIEEEEAGVLEAARWAGYHPGGEVFELQLDPPRSTGSWELELLVSSAAGEPVVHGVPVLWSEDE